MKRLLKFSATLYAIILASTMISCSSDEPEPDNCYVVYIDERCYDEMDNMSMECQQWKNDNEPYLTGHGYMSGAGMNGYTLHWTRYFKCKESTVKAWCNMVNGFSIYESEYRQDKFNARYYKEYHKEITYQPLSL